MIALRLAYRIWRRDRIERRKLLRQMNGLTNSVLIDRLWYDTPCVLRPNVIATCQHVKILKHGRVIAPPGSHYAYGAIIHNNDNKIMEAQAYALKGTFNKLPF